MPSSFSSGFCTSSVLSILTFNSLFFYFGPKLMVWHLEKLPFKKSLSYHWDALFLSSFKICSTSLIVSAACDSFIDGRRRTWIMFSFHQVLCKSFWNTFHKSGPREDPCGQPLVVSYQSLVVSGLILTPHFLLQK